MMSPIEVEELQNRISGMSREEQEIAVECLPLDLCIARIERVLADFSQMQNRVNEMAKMAGC